MSYREGVLDELGLQSQEDLVTQVMPQRAFLSELMGQSGYEVKLCGFQGWIVRSRTGFEKKHSGWPTKLGACIAAKSEQDTVNQTDSVGVESCQP